MSSASDDEADEGTVLRPVGRPPPRAAPSAPPRDTPAAAPLVEPELASPPEPSTWGPVTQTGLPRSSGNALPLRTRIGEFVLTRVIGEGGFGIVYEAHDDSLDRRVAIKEYFPGELAERTANLQLRSVAEEDEAVFRQGLASFINEAKILARFDHPSLLKVYRFWEANGTAYMVMPYYEGPTLLDALRRLRRPPDEAWLMGLLDPLTEALAVIHDARVYHRDIAPDNILLLAGTGQPLLLDFGAARRVIEGANQRAPTAIVKPGYAPIEQYAEVNMSQGPWSDVYALAAVLHFAITGRKPVAAIGRLVSDSLVPLATQAAGRYTPALLAAIDKALIVAPGERTQTMDAFRAAIGLPALTRDATGALVVGGSAPAGAGATATGALADPAREASRRDAGRPRQWWAWGGLAAALLAAALATAWWASTRPGEPAATVAAGTPAGPAPPAAAPEPAAGPAPLPAPTTPPTTPPTPPPAPNEAAPVAAPFNVVNEFARIQARSTPGYTVGLAWKPAPRFRIGAGDVLSMKVSSTREGYLYVLAYTPDNILFRYFPNEASRSNFVRQDEVVSLPRAGKDPLSGLKHEGIVLTDPPGTGHVLVIVSRHPRDFSALGQRREAVYPLYPVGEEAAALHGQGSDTPSIYLGQVQCPPGPPCVDEFGATTDRFEIVP